MDGPRMDIVTLASTDTYTEGSKEGVNPWTVHRWHNNFDIHGYLDRGGQVVLIRGWSMDGQIKGVVKVAIHGTLTFMDDTGLSMAAPDIPGNMSFVHRGSNHYCY